MAHRHICTLRSLEQPQLFCPRNRNLLRNVVAKSIAIAATSERIQQPCNNDPHLSVMKELRSHFTKSGILTNIGIVDVLRRWHPNHTITQTPKSTGILKLAKAGYAHATLDTSIDFYASRTYRAATDDAKGTGRLKDKVEFGRYKYRWKEQVFQLYVVEYWETEYSQVKNHYILYPQSQGDLIDGRSQTVDKLITVATQHLSEIKEEIWVYDRGYWDKNHKLWKNVQGCMWENVILNNEMKLQLVSDIEGFFDRKEDYKSFAVPWKRGIILHGLPGNGKTISIKALMHSLASRSTPIPTLYVKSLGKSCDQDDIRSIFEKARETGPCLLVFEDIDSLVSDDVKSFFLNEVDGLEENDGIMMVGSTNYCVITEGFSFAYIQEAFVTALLSIVQTQRANLVEPDASGISTSDDLRSNAVWQAISKQVQTLRKEMKDSRQSVEDAEKNSIMSDARSSSATSTGFGLSK
ncbi:hypothetical protein OEA41_009269 [Lepraria neglecta]|uniref:ATPase AAA-type core domain-containing protein n=1 Tax=Lepraria neglecta TaxID=209136 RepID=A0AAE0DHW2_9LECA|nr:hypothetical protein OEA41_009269 [Lepraria neglecta]